MESGIDEGEAHSLKRLLSVTEVAGKLGLPGWKIYELVGRQEIPHIRIGRRVFFRHAALVKWLDELEAKNGVGGQGRPQPPS